MSDAVYLGIAAAVSVTLLIDRYYTARYLISKSAPAHRTPFCIFRRFYYIVPEEEYIEITQRPL
jgi:hypothetical protein